MTTPLRRAIPLLLCLLAAAGCTAIKLDPKGEMVAVYQFGEFKMLFNTTAPVVAKAVQKVAQDMDLYQTSFKQSKFEGELKARARNDQEVVVMITEVNSRQTLISIRWGKAGDKSKSRKFYEAVEAAIGPM
jgi:hypothetical protein